MNETIRRFNHDIRVPTFWQQRIRETVRAHWMFIRLTAFAG